MGMLMFLSEINPFIRYADRFVYVPVNEFVRTYDCRLFYIIKGKCTVVLNDREYLAQEGTLMLWHSGNRYKLVTNDEITIDVINFDFTQKSSVITDSMTPALDIEFDPDKILERILFENCDNLNQPIIKNNMQIFESDIKQIVDEYNKKSVFFTEKCSGIMKKVIVDIVRNTLFVSSDINDKIESVMKYIEDNYAQDISNDTIGTLVGYHPYYLNKLMLTYTGTTIHQYLLSYRLNMAKTLLTGTNDTICEIADKCGFKTIHYFSNSFKRKFGISPALFRSTSKRMV